MTLLFLSVLLFILGGGYGTASISSINNDNVIVFAHRGATDNNLENSNTAFNISDSIGFTAIEIDVSSTKDGRIILFHDDSCSRVLGKNFRVDEMDWDEIKNDYLVNNIIQTKDKITPLNEFLEYNPFEIVYLDVKNSSLDMADSLLFLLKKYDDKTILVADGNLFFLGYLKKMNPKILTVFEGFNKGKEWLYYIIPKDIKPNYYSSFLSEVDTNHILFLKQNNLLNKKIVYGVDEKNIVDAYTVGIQNIIVDFNSKNQNLKVIKERLSKNK